MKREWVTRQATPGDREAALALLTRAHAGDQTAAPSVDEWDWLFLRNPCATDLEYVVADAGPRLAGQYATVPLRLQLAGATAKALLSLNTATDPDFQRQGVFTTLADELYNSATGRFALVYGFPNTRSAPGFFRRLEWHDLGSPPLLVRPLAHPGRGFSRRGAGLALGLAAPVLRLADVLGRRDGRVTSIDAFESWADGIWKTVAPRLGTAAVRDAAFLRWRFDDAPRQYRRWVIVDDGDAPVGYAVSRLVSWRGAVLAYVMELLAPSAAAASALLGTLLADARRDGAIAACAVATRRHPHRATMLRHGFVALPVRLGQEVSFGVRLFDQDIPRTAVLQLGAWHLSAADFDWI